MNDRYDLERYVRAQEPVFAQVCAELAGGRKQSHWMWFIFPQLRACTQLVNRIEGRTAGAIFGYPDELKFRSSMTLFARATAGGGSEPFGAALAKYFAGEEDPLTRELLAAE